MHPILRHLKRLDKSQRWLADALGLSPGFLNDIIKGRSSMPWETAKRLSVMFEEPAAVFMDWTPPTVSDSTEAAS